MSGLTHPTSGIRLRVVRYLAGEFEFGRRLDFVVCVGLVGEPDSEFDAVFLEDITHRPPVHVGQAGGVTEGDPFGVVECITSGDAFVLETPSVRRPIGGFAVNTEP